MYLGVSLCQLAKNDMVSLFLLKKIYMSHKQQIFFPNSNTMMTDMLTLPILSICDKLGAILHHGLLNSLHFDSLCISNCNSMPLVRRGLTIFLVKSTEVLVRHLVNKVMLLFC